jgi:hypothetical protein
LYRVTYNFNDDITKVGSEKYEICRSYRTQVKILSAHLIRWVRQSETHRAEPLVPEPSAFGVEVDIKKLKRCKLPGTGQI